jgi:hypothetical protein
VSHVDYIACDHCNTKIGNGEPCITVTECRVGFDDEITNMAGNIIAPVTAHFHAGCAAIIDDNGELAMLKPLNRRGIGAPA